MKHPAAEAIEVSRAVEGANGPHAGVEVCLIPQFSRALRKGPLVEWESGGASQRTRPSVPPPSKPTRTSSRSETIGHHLGVCAPLQPSIACLSPHDLGSPNRLKPFSRAPNKTQRPTWAQKLSARLARGLSRRCHGGCPWALRASHSQQKRLFGASLDFASLALLGGWLDRWLSRWLARGLAR